MTLLSHERLSLARDLRDQCSKRLVFAFRFCQEHDLSSEGLEILLQTSHEDGLPGDLLQGGRYDYTGPADERFITTTAYVTTIREQMKRLMDESQREAT